MWRCGRNGYHDGGCGDVGGNGSDGGGGCGDVDWNGSGGGGCGDVVGMVVIVVVDVGWNGNDGGGGCGDVVGRVIMMVDVTM